MLTPKNVWHRRGPLLATFTQSSVNTSQSPGITAATWEYMNNGTAVGSSQTATEVDGADGWIKADLGVQRVVARLIIGYDYTNSLGGNNAFGNSWTNGATLQSSNDNSTWTDIITLSLTDTVISLNNGLYAVGSGNARYFRLWKSGLPVACTQFQLWGRAN